jgi:hypothetical protein
MVGSAYLHMGADGASISPTRGGANFSQVDHATARERLDKTSSGFAKGAINAEVKFLDVPPNVRTRGEAKGEMFSDVTIQRTKQAPRPWEPTFLRAKNRAYTTVIGRQRAL